MKFYTNVTEHHGKILAIGYEDGKRFQEKLPYKPYIFIPSKTGNTRYHTLDKRPVDKWDFESISEARKFIKRYEGVANWEMFGLTNWAYLYIFDNYKGEIDYDPRHVRVINIDIEVAADDGFPDIELAQKPVTAITIKKGNEYIAFGCGAYTVSKPNVTYVRCDDEYDLLDKFLNLWSSANWIPDIITGWNVEFFDIPYIVNRIIRIMPEGYEKKLSPWGMLREVEVEWKGKKNKSYVPLGVTVLDYLQLYKKFTYTKQESYSLDFIANVELGEKKTDYSEYGTLLKLYQQNFQKFMDYNIRDVELVDRIEEKMKLIELVLALAYDAKVNFIDTLKSVRPWDIIIHNFLLGRCTVVPFFELEEDEEFEGAYVKEPIPGMYRWVVSFDLNSLYPHLIMQYNIGPETFVEQIQENITIDEILSGALDKFATALKRNNLCISANLSCYTRDKQGFLSELMEKMYNDRLVYKDKMIEAKRAYEKEKIYQHEKDIARYNNAQMAKKIQLNSCYGALGNKYFRWYQKVFAEAITMSGQLSIRWVEVEINKFMNKMLKTKNVDYVIASDTDSLYLNFEPIVNLMYPNRSREDTSKFIDRICEKVFRPEIDNIYQRLANYVNACDQKMFMKRENIADKGIWTAKKRYILNVINSEGVQYDKPKLKMMGIETVRSSTPQAVRQALKDAISIIINSDVGELIKFVDDFKAKFYQMSFEDVAFPRGVSDVDKWYCPNRLYKKGTPIHVKAALVYNKLLEDRNLDKSYAHIYNGDRIRFAYLQYPNPILEHSIACASILPQEFNIHAYIDYEKQFQKTFLDPLRHILDAIMWSLRQDGSLDSFFE
jgi:DNA polymerase elongation subunit (family B)